MKWKEAVRNYPNKWLLFEAIEAYSKDGKRIIEDLSVICWWNNRDRFIRTYRSNYRLKQNACI